MEIWPGARVAARALSQWLLADLCIHTHPRMHYAPTAHTHTHPRMHSALSTPSAVIPASMRDARATNLGTRRPPNSMVKVTSCIANRLSCRKPWGGDRRLGPCRISARARAILIGTADANGPRRAHAAHESHTSAGWPQPSIGCSPGTEGSSSRTKPSAHAAHRPGRVRSRSSGTRGWPTPPQTPSALHKRLHPQPWRGRRCPHGPSLDSRAPLRPCRSTLCLRGGATKRHRLPAPVRRFADVSAAPVRTERPEIPPRKQCKQRTSAADTHRSAHPTPRAERTLHHGGGGINYPNQHDCDGSTMNARDPDGRKAAQPPEGRGRVSRGAHAGVRMGAGSPDMRPKGSSRTCLTRQR